MRSAVTGLPATSPGNVALILLRYLVIGGIYSVLVIFVVLYAVLAGVQA